MILNNTVRTFDTDQVIAQIGKNTLMACGAREYKYGPDEKNNGYLMFRVNDSKRQQYIRITLMPQDLYNVDLIKVKRKTHAIEILERKSDVFCDDLSDIVYHMVNK